MVSEMNQSDLYSLQEKWRSERAGMLSSKAYISFDTFVVRNRMRWRNGKVRGLCWYHPGICLEGLRKCTEISIGEQVSRPSVEQVCNITMCWERFKLVTTMFERSQDRMPLEPAECCERVCSRGLTQTVHQSACNCGCGCCCSWQTAQQYTPGRVPGIISTLSLYIGHTIQ
jgi:hypothetical protein